MRGPDHRVHTLILGGACAALLACAIAVSATDEGEFQVSFAPGSLDGAGQFMGGTEIRLLTAHDGKP